MGIDTLLKEINVIVTQRRERASAAKAIADAIREAGAYRWTGIYDVNLEKGVVSNIAWSGSGAPAYPSFPVTKGLTSRAITTKKTVNVGDVVSDPDYLTALATTRSEIIIPVLDAAGDRVLGTIDIESERPKAFDSETQQCLEKCATALRRFWKITSSDGLC